MTVTHSAIRDINSIPFHRGRMRKNHEMLIATVKPQLTQRTEKVLSDLLRDIVPVIEEQLIARVKDFPFVQKGVTKTVAPRHREDGGMRTRLSQAEKVLQVLLEKPIVRMEDLIKELKQDVETYRMSAYLWDLKQIGAVIIRHKEGRKVVALELKNHKRMTTYLNKRLAQVRIAA